MVIFVLWCQMRSVGFARIIVMLGPLGWPAATQECSRHSCEPGWVKINTRLHDNKKGRQWRPFLLWRRGWDLNPRRAINPCWFSRPVHSAALPPLQ